MPDCHSESHPDAARRHWMSVLARADAGEIESSLSRCGALPAYARLRGPESGLVMVRGRMGGGGSGFNLGEMTVTRCTVCIDTGQTGQAYIAGLDQQKAELAALVDAMLQDPVRAPGLMSAVIDPLAKAQQARRDQIAAKAAATKVQFFAMRNMRAGDGA